MNGGILLFANDAAVDWDPWLLESTSLAQNIRSEPIECRETFIFALSNEQ